MMWKTFMFLTVTCVVLAGKINNKRNANYAFEIKHDYNYLKHHEKSENNVQSETEEQAEEAGNEEQGEEVSNEPEQANNEGEVEESEAGNDEEHESPGYEFSYKVIDTHTHDIKGQHEKKHGGEVKGVYWLLQPDGYKRTVDYHANKHSGFHAKVDYTKYEDNIGEEESKAKSEYYVKTYHGAKKEIPVTEQQEEEQEQERQEEAAQHIPIYVI